MTYKQVILSAAVLTGMVGVACLSREPDAGTAGLEMTRAADAFLTMLDADQKKQAVYPYDSAERFNWDFVPLQDASRKPTRKGLRLEEMTAPQKEAAKALLKAGTGAKGYATATTIMSLESILNELEGGKGNVRNPEWYFFTLFGTPAKEQKWGWRVEGHHLSINAVVDNGKIISTTPLFYGCNPATVLAGPRKGERAMPEVEDMALELFGSLDADQRKVAFQNKQFPEVKQRIKKVEMTPAVGLPAGKMNEKQQALLLKLLDAYAVRMPKEVHELEMAKIKQAGFDKVYFAFAREDDKKGKPHTYRIQGPTFLIEFINVQADSAGNPANHIHSVWHNAKGDFGL